MSAPQQSNPFVDALCYNIFDDITPSGKEFIIDGKLNETTLLAHPKLRIQVLFQDIWNAYYGTFAPSQVFPHIYSKSNGDINTLVKCVKEYLFITQFHQIAFASKESEIQKCIACINGDPLYVKRRIIEKLLMRFNASQHCTAHLTSQSLSQSFLEIWKHTTPVQESRESHESQMIHHTATPRTYFLHSVIDDRFVEVEYHPLQGSLKSAEYMQKDMYHYAIYKSANLTLKLVSTVTIVIDIQCNNYVTDVQRRITHAIKHIISLTGKPVIFIRNDIHILDEYIKENAYVYTLYDSLWDCIPHISKKCIVMTNTKHIVSHKALHPHSSILFWCSSHDSIPLNTLELFDQCIVPYNYKPRGASVEPALFYSMNRKEEWKHYIQSSSPYKMLVNIHQHHLLYLDFMARYYGKYSDSIEKYMQDARDTKTTNVVVLVDNRENFYSVLSMKFSMWNTKWNGVIITSKKCMNYYTKELPFVHVIHDPLLDADTFDIDIYNEVLEREVFWQRLEDSGYTGHALIIQDDGMIVRPGIDIFLKYDYVGAPWADDERNTYIKQYITENLVGNGGLSLRKISVMKDICKRFYEHRKELFYFNLNRIPEDVFFVKHLVKIKASIAPFEMAKRFAAEQVVDINSIGMHKFWAYNQTQDVRRVFQAFLSFSPQQ